MGRLTQAFDYLNKDPKKLSAEVIRWNYTHLEITGGMKKLRAELKLYKSTEKVMDSKVNNWKAASELESFKQKYLDPLNKKVVGARAILDDPNYKWKGDQKNRAKEKYQMLDTQNIDFYRLYNAVSELIQQHERQSDMLAKMYNDWYEKVSSKGYQPSEMMSMQAAILQEMFEEIYYALEPLKLELKAPQTTKNIEDDN